jgi:hypothetical protein
MVAEELDADFDSIRLVSCAQVTEISLDDRNRTASAGTPRSAADRLAIRELIDAYAHCADRRDAKGQMALFTTDTRFIVFMDATAAEPKRGRPRPDHQARSSCSPT